MVSGFSPHTRGNRIAREALLATSPDPEEYSKCRGCQFPPGFPAVGSGCNRSDDDSLRVAGGALAEISQDTGMDTEDSAGYLIVH
ncbi:hypothetical protein HG530_015712 [Fusarium avenaceum]|nr:hypothetical protein HG530_015712 [Fusarium avenaceum]